MTSADPDVGPAAERAAEAPIESPESPPAQAIATDPTAPSGCPFLLAEGGGWRLDRPSRDHRCAAVSPAAALSPEKQARLCLTPAHASCATYLASISARATRLGMPVTERTTRWALTRTTTVIEDTGGLRTRVMGFLLDRRRWPAIPAVLLVGTLFTLAVSGFQAGGVGTVDPTVTPAPATATPAPATATPGPTPSEAPEPSPTTPPSAAPSPTAAASPTPAESFRTYRVKSGDTLSAIAAQFGTTSREIAQLNGISVSSTLRVGQVLKIPN